MHDVMNGDRSVRMIINDVDPQQQQQQSPLLPRWLPISLTIDRICSIIAAC